MFRFLAIFVFSGVLFATGVERWSRRNDGIFSRAAPEEGGLLLERPAAATEDQSPVLELTSPPLYGLCHVHNVAMFSGWGCIPFEATVDVPESVRSARFPRAPFRLIPKRVVIYDRPQGGVCGGDVSSYPPKILICPACVAAQEEWFRGHPAPAQFVVRIPGQEPF